jgi:hypothetical protein
MNAMSECFNAEGTEFPHEHYPLHLSTIRHYQLKDDELRKLAKNNPLYSRKTYKSGDKEYDVLMYKETRIVVPNRLQKKAVTWYHNTLLHPGETRTEATIAQHFYWKGLRTDVLAICKRCDICQRTKKGLIKYGKLPVKKNEQLIPWHTLCIDLIGPYKIGDDIKKKVKGKIVIVREAPTLWCLTMIDPATNWFEVAQIHDKTSAEVANELEINWLNRYPLPTEITMDKGREFLGDILPMLETDYNIKRKVITTRNPQSNSIVERCHQTLHNHLRTMQMHKKSPEELKEHFGEYLSAVTKALNSTVHTTLNATPTQLVFGRDAFLPVSFQADWTYIADRKQRLIVQNNTRENKKRKEHTYVVNDTVMIRHDPNRKHGDDTYKGPYPVTQVYDNGTVQLRIPKGAGAELIKWNIRNIRPYLRPDQSI